MLLLKCLSPKIFLFSYLKLHLIEITSAKKIFQIEPKTIFSEFFKNVQICRHFGTPFVLVFFRGMTYFKEHVTLSTGKH